MAAVLFLFGYGIPIVRPDLPGWLVRVCDLVVWSTWVLLALDYLVRFGLAENRRHHVRRHWFDLLVVVLPLLRPLRLLQLLTLLGALNRRAATSLRGRIAVYAAGGAALLGVCAALAVLDAERGAPGATITGLDDALWRAITTMTTVGYGDTYPVIGTGRLVAAALMVGGVALLGVVTATFASWLVERVSDVNEEAADDLRDEITALRRSVSELTARLPGTPPPGAVG